jgi:predicted nucleic acid-binding Zn ribbon protein
MTKKRHTKRPEDRKEIIGKVIGKLEKRGPGKKEKVLNAWKKTAGQAAAGHSRPVGVKRKIITIEVDSSTWLYNLSLKKGSMLKALRLELQDEEDIKDIRFRMGDVV